VEENGDTAKVFYKAEGSDKEESGRRPVFAGLISNSYF